ncbi:hypothetical protein [Pararhizobium sp.]|uniref:hypothetical protein n=1 Tax=Pararhizobium sp. TaxID=1977563 RepID=UPI003D0B8880
MYTFGGFHISFYSFAIAISLLVVGGVVLLSAKYVIKPFLVFLIVAGAISSYYTDFLAL